MRPPALFFRMVLVVPGSLRFCINFGMGLSASCEEQCWSLTARGRTVATLCSTDITTTLSLPVMNVGLSTSDLLCFLSGRFPIFQCTFASLVKIIPKVFF